MNENNTLTKPEPAFTIDEARLIQLCIEFANNDNELLYEANRILVDEGIGSLPDNILGSIWDKLNLILRPGGQSEERPKFTPEEVAEINEKNQKAVDEFFTIKVERITGGV